MPKTKKKSEIKALTTITDKTELDECFDGIAKTDQELKRLKFCALLRIGMSPHKAAKTVGFSNAFCVTDVYRQMKNPRSALRKAQAKLDEFTKMTASRYRKSFAPLLAPTLAEIDLKMAEKMLDDPELAIRNPTALKQLKQQAGILAEEAPPQPMINIKECANLMLSLGRSQSELPAPAAVKGGFIDIEPMEVESQTD